MDAAEFMEWVAFEMINDVDYKQKLINEIHLEKSAKKTADERAVDIIKMFESLGRPNGTSK